MDKALKVLLTCQIGKSLDLAKFAINSAIKNSGMRLGFDYDICFICWKTSDEVYKWLDNNALMHVTLDWESDPDQSFHHLLYNGWRAGYEIAYQYSDYHVPIATDHYFFKDWLKNLYADRVEEGIVSCTLVERGKCFSLHPTCDLGLTTNEDFDFEKAEKVYEILFDNGRVEDIYDGKYHLDHGIQRIKGNTVIRQDAMPFIISKKTYDKVGPMKDFDEFGTTGDTVMFQDVKSCGMKLYRSRGSISYHVGAVETNRNATQKQ
jgi:hypothetical protein